MIWRPYIQLIIVFALLLAEQSISMAASNGSVSVSATILSNSNCRFPPSAGTTLAFGNLDPTNPVSVSTTTTLQYRCGGSVPIATFIITADDGNHFSGGSRRMENGGAPGEYIPYQLALSPQATTAPRNVNQTLTIDGLIDGTGYQYATVGTYADVVTLSINP